MHQAQMHTTSLCTRRTGEWLSPGKAGKVINGTAGLLWHFSFILLDRQNLSSIVSGRVMQSGFHCINCPLTTVWRQTVIRTTS